MKAMQTKELVLCALFAALIAVGAWIRVPIPLVPFTLQFLFTTLAGLLLGGRCGALSTALYVAMGLLGLPIFAEGGGFGYVWKPSFGYLLGFIAGSYVTGVLAHRRRQPSLRTLLMANVAGCAVVYLLGMLYYALISRFYLGTPIGLWPLFLYCFVLAVPGDIALCVVSAGIAKRMQPILTRSGMERKVL